MVEAVKILGQSYSHFKPASSALDRKFIGTLKEIEKDYKGAFPQTRDQGNVEQWALKLSEEPSSSNPKNRNKYAMLLKLCVCDMAKFEGIFRRAPPSEEGLKELESYEVLDIEHYHEEMKTR